MTLKNEFTHLLEIRLQLSQAEIKRLTRPFTKRPSSIHNETWKLDYATNL